MPLTSTDDDLIGEGEEAEALVQDINGAVVFPWYHPIDRVRSCEASYRYHLPMEKPTYVCAIHHAQMLLFLQSPVLSDSVSLTLQRNPSSLYFSHPLRWSTRIGTCRRT